jgi:iron complex outermembrane receptor protein
MTNKFFRVSACVAASVIALASADIAAAQTTAPAPADAAEADAGDIVVTAQKRAENLQDVPISIAAVSSERLRASKIDSISDLGKVAAGFTTARSTQATNTKLYIRGIGGGGNYAVDPSVAVFVDDAYVARPGAIIGNIFDVSGIEVLRGPQGTLFGRNASAGAVSVHTTAPSDELGGYINAELGSFGAYKLEGAVTLPASEKFAVRFAGLASGFDGFGTTSINPHRYGRSDTIGGRLSLLLKPTETITWTVRADYLSTTGDGQAELEIDPRTLTPTAIANLNTRLRGNIPDIVNPFDRQSNQIVDGSLTDLQYGITSDFSLELGDYTLRMVNNVRNWNSNQRDADLIQTPLPILQRTALFDSDAQSHELQLISPDTLLDGRLKFVAGLYYFRERFKAGEDYDLKPEWCGTIVPLISAALVPSCLAGQQDGASIFRFDQTTNSYAGFAQATFEILPKLEFTAGGRYTKDERSARYDLDNYNATMAVVRSAEHTLLDYKDERFTYRLNLSYKPTSQLMLFGTYSTGYKAGAFNNATGTPALGQRRLVGPEEVKNYEIGFRSEWFDRSLTINATAYRVDVKGFQDRGYDGISSVIRNAGDLRQQGFEADINWRATRGLSFSGGVQYLDSRFTDYPAAPGLPGFGGTQNLTGKSPTFAPEWQGNVAVDLKGELGSSGWKYKLHSDVAFQSDANVGLTNDNNPQTVQAGYALVGAQASITLPGDRLTLSIYGQNLTAQNYCSQYYNVILDSVLGLRNATTGGTAQRCVVGAPRTYGARIGYTF